MNDTAIRELAKSLPFPINTVRNMVDNFEYLFGREPNENDRCLISPLALLAAAQIKRQGDHTNFRD